MPHRFARARWLVVALSVAMLAAGCAGSSPTATPSCGSPRASGSDAACNAATGVPGGGSTAAPSSSTAAKTPSKTPAKSPNRTTGPLPEKWSGMIAFDINASPRNRSTAGVDEYGTVKRAIVFAVFFERDDTGDATASWTSTSGGATATTDDELWQGSQGDSQRETTTGGGYAKIPGGTCKLSTKDGGTRFALRCDEVRIEGLHYVLYEPNEPGTKMEDGDAAVHSPTLDVDGIAGSAAAIEGSRTIDAVVGTFSQGTHVEAMARWSLTAGDVSDDAPVQLAPLRVNGDPLAVTLDGPSAPMRTGVPLVAGKPVSLVVSGNTVGGVKVALLDQDGKEVLTGMSSGTGFSAGSYAPAKSGVFTVVIDTGAASSGEFSIAVKAE